MPRTRTLAQRLAARDPFSDARRIAVLMLLFFAISCRDGLTNPDSPNPAPEAKVAGWVSIALTTPNPNDGVVQLSLSGAPIDSLELVGSRGFASLLNGTGRLLVTGQIASGVVARMWVPDIKATSSYVGTVEAAAARFTYQLQDVSQGYSVKVTR